MGVDVGDYNLDGYMDMYITNLYDNVLYKNNGDGTFENVGAALGVNDPGMGWGNVFADFDNDRLPDIYVVNDTYFSPYNNVLYHNTGSGFEIVSEGDPCESPYGGYATVASDLNDDGLMDLLVANNGAPGVQLFQNKSTGTGHYIGFYLEGVASNRDAVGAKIEIHTPAGVQYDQVIGNSGWAADNGRWIHFGLADQTSVDKVVIKWPSGFEEQIEDLQADQKFRVREGEGVVTSSKEIGDEIQTCQMIISENDLNIHLSTQGAIQVLQLTDMAGRSIPANAGVSDDDVKIKLPSMPSGIYQVMVIQAGQTCMSRFWHVGIAK